MNDLFKSPPNMICEARASGRGHKCIIELLIFIPVFLITGILGSLPTIVAGGVWILRDPAFISEAVGLLQAGDVEGYTESILSLTATMPPWMQLVSLFSTALTTIGVILFCRWVEKRGLPTLGLRRGNILREYLTGVAAALLMISAAVGTAWLSGAYRFEAGHASLPALLLYMLGFMLQGLSEEVICRGYFMVSLARKNPLWLSVLLSSIVFSLLHLTNPGFSLLAFINIFLIGVVFAVYMLKRGNIWGVAAMHSFWNFFQGNLYGISVSGGGVGDATSLLHAQAAAGAALWNGGAFGIEGSLCTTIVEIVALLIFIFLLPCKKDELPAPEPYAAAPELADAQ